jgi:hypothetical protein
MRTLLPIVILSLVISGCSPYGQPQSQRFLPIAPPLQASEGVPWHGFFALDTQTGQLCRTADFKFARAANDVPASPAAQPKTWEELKRQAAQPQTPEDNRPPPKTAEEYLKRLAEPQPGNVNFNALPTCAKLLSSGESKR